MLEEERDEQSTDAAVAIEIEVKSSSLAWRAGNEFFTSREG
jgi:hypothetical protein